MKGWKTWGGAAVIGIAACLEAMGGEYAVYSKAIMMVGTALGLVGIGHKVEKGGQA